MTDDYRDRIAARLAPLVAEMHRAANRQEAEAAKLDPQAHKLSRVMEKGLSYHYAPAGKGGWGRTVWFCWSCHRNVAGYFLGWREVREKKGGGKRDQWAARKVRRRVQELAHRRAAAYRARRDAKALAGVVRLAISRAAAERATLQTQE